MLDMPPETVEFGWLLCKERSFDTKFSNGIADLDA